MTRREKGLFIGSFFLFFFLFTTRTLLEGDFYCNDQFGFGLFPMNAWYLGIEILILIAILCLSIKAQDFSERCIFSILFVGGFSNICERIFFGCVLDYLRVPFIGSFVNVADILITVALIYLTMNVLVGGFKK